jgi:hypothetical protein
MQRCRRSGRATWLQLVHYREWDAGGEEADSRSLDPKSRYALHRSDNRPSRRVRLSSRAARHEYRRARVPSDLRLRVGPSRPGREAYVFDGVTTSHLAIPKRRRCTRRYRRHSDLQRRPVATEEPRQTGGTSIPTRQAVLPDLLD